MRGREWIMPAAAAVLAPLAAGADADRMTGPWLIALDVAVGLAFPFAARGGPLLFAAVGPAWLAASVAPGLQGVHQGLLAVGLLGRGRGAARWWVAGPAAVVATGIVPRSGVAVLFAVVALLAVVTLPELRRARAAVAAAAVALVLGASAAGLPPVVALVAYEVTLLAVAVLVPSLPGIADRVLGREAGGLDAALAEALDDPKVAIVAHDEPGSLRVDDENGRPLGYVRHSGGALADPRVAASVAAAVRLVLTRERLQREQEDLVRRQAEAQARLVAAADRQRERIAAELRQRVEAPLRLARQALADMGGEPRDGRAGDESRSSDEGPGSAGAAASLGVVAGEIDAAIGEISALVWAVPGTELGDGRLAAALESLARTSPIRVDVNVTAVADRTVETAVHYVFCELLTNVIKHAAASWARITVQRFADDIWATVEDNGRGGADPAGSGIQGLDDRLAPLGGRLWLESPPGSGTAVVFTVPG